MSRRSVIEAPSLARSSQRFPVQSSAQRRHGASLSNGRSHDRVVEGDRNEQLADEERLGQRCPDPSSLGDLRKAPGQGSFVPGDDFVYYALRGDISRVVAIGKIVGRPRYEAHRDPGWPWLIDIAIEAKRDLISDGVHLHKLDVDRTLKRSVTQKSHIRLTPAEFALARREFGLA